MEKQLKLKTDDGYSIHGTHLSGKKKSDTLIILVHGFLGHQNEHIFFNAAEAFDKEGVDSFRMDLYGGEKGQRHFEKTGIKIYGEDITQVLRYFRKKYKKIYLFGHSYGGPSLFFADQEMVDGYILLDPSWVKWSEWRKFARPEPRLRAYLGDWGFRFVVANSFVKDLKTFPDNGQLIAGIHKPILCITATHGNEKAGKKYFAKANKPMKLINITGADHNFSLHKWERRIFTETLKWLKEHKA